MEFEALKQQLMDHFDHYLPLSAEERDAIVTDMKVHRFPKGHILLREGEVARECYFVLQGCVRQYHLIDGIEKTTDFFTELRSVASLNSMSQGIPADHYFDCIEDCILVVGTAEQEDALYERYPRILEVSRLVMEDEFGDQQKRMSRYITDSPEQRYLNLQDNFPSLLERVPQYQLASYIGVTPESLSRIRKRIQLRQQVTS